MRRKQKKVKKVGSRRESNPGHLQYSEGLGSKSQLDHGFFFHSSLSQQKHHEKSAILLAQAQPIFLRLGCPRIVVTLIMIVATQPKAVGKISTALKEQPWLSSICITQTHVQIANDSHQASARAVPVSVYDSFPRLTVRLVSASISCHILVYCREVDRRCKWLSIVLGLAVLPACIIQPPLISTSLPKK